MILFSRTDNSMFGRWWWTVDRWMLAALAIVILFGIFLIPTASPAVAERIGYDSHYFIIRHFVILPPAIMAMIAISLLTPRRVLLLASAIFAVGIVGMMLTPFIGVETKGAHRWLRVAGFALQPSEFVKPAFIVINAWLLSHPAVRSLWGPRMLPALLLLTTVGLLMMQPDLGMSSLITLVWLGQLFVAGLPMMLVVVMIIMGFGALGAAYLLFPHVTSRIDRFLNPESGDNYQIERALEAFRAGGLLGVGPGQGTIKEQIPDAHTDFIFAVAGEELGAVLCLILLGVMLFIILRGFFRAAEGPTLFVSLASSGLVLQFAAQTLINLASALHLMPTKGMTLPFISYGGSSLLAMGIGMGMLLALTRKRTHSP